MKEEFQNIQNREEILSILFESIDETYPAMLWQEHLDGTRKYISGYLKEINEGKLALGLLQDEKNPIEIDKELVIKVNVTGNYSNFYFQSKANFISTLNIVIPIPTKIRFRSKRDKVVNFYEDPEDNLIEYKILNKRKDKKFFRAQILKLAPSKVTFYSDEMGKGKITLGEELLIMTLSKHLIPNYQIGKVKYVCYYDAQGTSRRRPARITLKLIPSIPELAELKLHIEKEEKRFGMEEIEWLQKEKGEYKEVVKTIGAQNSFEYGYEEDGFFYGYKLNEQDSVLHEISLRDERLSMILRENCQYLESLIYLTPIMRQELFRDNDITVLSFALRLSTRHLIGDIMEGLSSHLRAELLYNLKEKKTATAVLKAQKEIIRYVRQREAMGTFILSSKNGKKEI